MKLFKRTYSENGMSTVQAAVIATMVAMAAAGMSSIMVYQQRQSKLDQFRYVYHQEAARANFYLNSMGTFKVTSDYNTNPGLAFDGNGMLNVCMNGNSSGNSAIKTCLESGGASWNNQYGYAIMLKNVIGEFVVGSVAPTDPCSTMTPPRGSCPARYSSFNQNGVPVSVTDSSAYLNLKFFFKPVCGAAWAGGSTKCYTAQNFILTYVLESQYPYMGTKMATLTNSVTVTHDQIAKAAIDGQSPYCDNTHGYVPVGVNPDGTFKCGVPRREMSFLAQHYLLTSAPAETCSFTATRADGTTYKAKFTDMTTQSFAPSPDMNLPTPATGGNYSFAGIWVKGRVGLGANLGSLGSCINNSTFEDGFYKECDKNGCHTGQTRNASMWLRALDTNPPQTPTQTSPGVISRCSVCAIDGPVVVVHGDTLASFNDNRAQIPNCPTGYDRLYWGVSLAGLSLDSNEVGRSNETSPQDRGSPGSCLPMNTAADLFAASPGASRLPFIGVDTSSGTPGYYFRSMNNRAQYHGLEYDNSHVRPFNCAVCWKPSVAAVPTTPIQAMQFQQQALSGQLQQAITGP